MNKKIDPLSGAVYSKLLTLVPAILEWLRDRDLLGAAKNMQNAGMFLLDPSLCPKVKPELLNEILAYLAAEINEGPMARARKKRGKNQLPASNMSLNFLMISKSIDVTYWCVAVLKIFRDANPRAIPTSVLHLDIAKNPDISPALQKEELGKLDTILSRDFSSKALIAFGELCSTLRDALSLSGESEYLRTVANTIGRALLGGEGNGGGNIMQVCIKRCYSLFPFLPQKNANWQVKGCRNRLPVGSDPAMTKRLVFDKLRKDLIVFYELKDSKLVPTVPLLMRSYNIYQLALGLLIKYGCLPLGWREFLAQGNGRTQLEWFSSNLAFISQDVVVTKKKFYIPGKARKRYEQLKAQTKNDELNRIGTELVKKKMEYVSSLEAFINEFVSEIKFIAGSEAFGTEARSALGITSSEIEKLMGSTLKQVLTVEQKIAADLECLTLLPCQVKQDCQRAGLLCKVLLKHKEETVRAYTNYGISYERWEDTLKNLLKDVNKAKVGEDSIHLHFVDVYTELRRTNATLGSSIDVVLQNPVGYLTKIPLYLERMKKHIEKKLASKHPAYKILSESLLKFRELVQEVNQGIGDSQGSFEASTKTAKKPGRNRTATNTSSFLAFTPSRRKNNRRNKAVNVSAGSYGN